MQPEHRAVRKALPLAIVVLVAVGALLAYSRLAGPNDPTLVSAGDDPSAEAIPPSSLGPDDLTCAISDVPGGVHSSTPTKVYTTAALALSSHLGLHYPELSPVAFVLTESATNFARYELLVGRVRQAFVELERASTFDGAQTGWAHSETWVCQALLGAGEADAP